MTQTVEQHPSNETQEIEYPSIGLKLFGVVNTSKDKIIENIAANVERDHPRVWPFKEQDTEVVFCAGGPSLLKGIEEVREKQENGAKVIALANTAHLLKKHGIHFSGHVLLDAKPRNAEFITDEDTKYFIASQCDPSVFDRAEETGSPIYLYHAVNNDEEFQIIREKEEMWVPIQGGSTITMRAIRLFTILGFKKFHIYGWDSCFMDGNHHAYEQPDADKQKVFKFEFEDRVFEVTPWMISQVMEMQNFFKQFCMNIDLCVHGDGLIAYVIEKAYKQKIKIEET